MHWVGDILLDTNINLELNDANIDEKIKIHGSYSKLININIDMIKYDKEQDSLNKTLKSTKESLEKANGKIRLWNWKI